MVGDVAALLNKQKTFALMNIPQQVDLLTPDQKTKRMTLRKSTQQVAIC